MKIVHMGMDKKWVLKLVWHWINYPEGSIGICWEPERIQILLLYKQGLNCTINCFSPSTLKLFFKFLHILAYPNIFAYVHIAYLNSTKLVI